MRFRTGCIVAGFLSLVLSLPAQTIATLHLFDGTDGSNPNAGLVQATDGNFYGTTLNGGATSNFLCTAGCGTLFKITPGGTVTTLYNFCAQSSCTDGASPVAAVVRATNGTLYGTTQNGGANDCDNLGFYEDCGTVFKITLDGTLTTLHVFDNTDGAWPSAALVQATKGDFYGTTGAGGTVACHYSGCGTVFKITPSGVLTTLHDSCSQNECTDGGVPVGALVQATNGTFYGTMFLYGGGGGEACGGVFTFSGCGTVFKITPDGALTTLHAFDLSDGSGPTTLLQAANGDFYGTTNYGGNCYPYGCGTVFKITPKGTLTTLYSFCSQSGCPDGEVPSALVQATDGNFYGTTAEGGANSQGTLFKITPSGTLTTLYSFCSQSNCADGAYPQAALFQATDGNLYGTTAEGGASDCTNGCGTVFRLSVGLSPFVETQTTSGKVGAHVKILGTNLTGSSSVTFNGTAAKFKVVSKSEIQTAVPDGATTGFVTVTTPTGKLKSNKKFRVIS